MGHSTVEGLGVYRKLAAQNLRFCVGFGLQRLSNCLKSPTYTIYFAYVVDAVPWSVLQDEKYPNRVLGSDTI